MVELRIQGVTQTPLDVRPEGVGWNMFGLPVEALVVRQGEWQEHSGRKERGRASNMEGAYLGRRHVQEQMY